MGQYYKIINLDKKEYLYAHKFGDGLKLLEFGSSGSGMMCGLAVLLANSNNRGGGDLDSENPIIGSWAADRIVIAGDYAEPGDPGEEDTKDPQGRDNLYNRAEESFKDISDEVIKALCDDKYLARDLKNRGAKGL